MSDTFYDYGSRIDPLVDRAMSELGGDDLVGLALALLDQAGLDASAQKAIAGMLAGFGEVGLWRCGRCDATHPAPFNPLDCPGDCTEEPGAITGAK